MQYQVAALVERFHRSLSLRRLSFLPPFALVIAGWVLSVKYDHGGLWIESLFHAVFSLFFYALSSFYKAPVLHFHFSDSFCPLELYGVSSMSQRRISLELIFW